MEIIVLGTNHKTAPVEIREKLAIGKSRLKDVLQSLHQQDEINECAVLSTCNRVEIYAAVAEIEPAVESIRRFLSEYSKEDLLTFKDRLYVYKQPESIKHLFRVASGLDAMVIGEKEIVGQVREAYQKALKASTLGKLLRVLFQRSLKVSKKVRNETNIDKGTISVSSTAVDLAKKIFGNLSEKRIMIIGAGQTGELTLRHLVDSGVHSVMASNRSYDRAVELAEKFDGRAIRFDDRVREMINADIIISSTASLDFIIHKDEVVQLMQNRKNRPIFFIDIAVPRDIDPAVNQLDNVHLYNIDDLKVIVGENIQKRQLEIEQCNKIIDDETRIFVRLVNSLDVDPTLKKLYKHFETIRSRELRVTLSKLKNLPVNAQSELEHLTKRLVNQLLYTPTNRLKKLGKKDPNYIELVDKLFGLDEKKQEDDEDK